MNTAAKVIVFSLLVAFMVTCFFIAVVSGEGFELTPAGEMAVVITEVVIIGFSFVGVFVVAMVVTFLLVKD